MNATRRIVASVSDARHGNSDLIVDVQDIDNDNASCMWVCRGVVGTIPNGHPSSDYDIVFAVTSSLGLDILSVNVDASMAVESVLCAVDLVGMSIDEVASKSSVSRSVVSDLFSGVSTLLSLVDAMRIERGLAFIYRENNLISTGEIVSLVPSHEAKVSILNMMLRSMSVEDISDMSGVSANMINGIIDDRRGMVPSNIRAKLSSTEERTRRVHFSPASSLSRASAYRKAQLISSTGKFL